MSSIADCDLKIVPLSLSELDHVSGGFTYFFVSSAMDPYGGSYMPSKPKIGEMPYVPSGPSESGSAPVPAPTTPPPSTPTPPPGGGGGGGGGSGWPEAQMP